MNYNHQDAKTESQQEYFGTINTDNTKTLQNALDRIEELENTNTKISAECHKLVDSLEQKQIKIEELEQQIEQLKGCHNCRHFAEPYKLCCYSLGDEDYDCRGRKWEIKENDR